LIEESREKINESNLKMQDADEAQIIGLPSPDQQQNEDLNDVQMMEKQLAESQKVWWD